MVKFHTYKVVPLLVLFFTACDDRRTSSSRLNHSNQPSDDTVLRTTGPLLDSAIYFNTTKSTYRGPELTEGLARQIIYAYFLRKGYLISDSLPQKLTENDYENLSVQYDTLFKVSINNNNYLDAVVTYWLTPPGASGNCWQPHKAIVTDTDRGYEVSDEDFIKTDFSIESSKIESEQSVLSGLQYDCSNHQALRPIKITLRSK